MIEKIYQNSKKKMVLDHLIVESLDNNEEKLDVQALLLHGLKALFEDTGEKDIKYDDNDIENLLDRSKLEESIQQPTEDSSFGSFKTARIWANSTARLEDLEDKREDLLEVGYWDRIIQERLSLAEAERAAEEEQRGRGKRRAGKKVTFFLTVLNSGRLYCFQLAG
jgi:chromodomain-helicase-DNA-binding protein 4